MPQGQRSVTIQRPVKAVFAYLADGANLPQWRPGEIVIEHVAGEGIGTTYRQVVSGPLGRRVAADYVITQFEPDRLIEFQTTAGPTRSHGTYELESEGGVTRLNFSLQVQLGGWKTLFLGSTVDRILREEMAALDTLKDILEGEHPAASGPVPGR